MDKSSAINSLVKSLDFSYFDKSQYAQYSEAIDIGKYLIAKGYNKADILNVMSETIVFVNSSLPTS